MLIFSKNKYIQKRKEARKMKVISGNTNTSAKALLTAAGKNTLRYIHDNYGLDFEQPFILEKLNEKFTVNKIWSFIPHYLYDFTVVAVVHDERLPQYNIAKILSNGIDIELPNKNKYDHKTRPEHYYLKGDFDKDRKKGNDYFIIAQQKNYIRPVKEKENPVFDENHRYIITKTNHSYLYFKDPEKQGKEEYYSSGRFVYDRRSNNFENWFDKSGYLVIRQQERLQQEAKKLRTEREKAKYLETDNTSYIEKVRYEFNKLKTYSIGLLAAASNYETLKNISHCFDWKIAWILFDIELFEQRTNNKEYASIEKSMTAYNNILSKIQKAYDELNGKDEKENGKNDIV